MSRKLSVVLCLVVILGIAVGPANAARPDFSPGAPGIGDPYFPLDGNGGYDVKHYLLDVRYDPTSDVLRDAPPSPHGQAAPVALQSRPRRRARGRLGQGRPPICQGLPGGDELTVTPSRGIRKGTQFVVVIDYAGIPPTLPDGSGFIHTDDGALVIGNRTWLTPGSRPMIIRSIGPRTRF